MFRAIKVTSIVAGITGGVSLGAFSWEARTPQSCLQTSYGMATSIGMGALIGLFTGPAFFPLIALVFMTDTKNDWKMIERSKEKYIFEAVEPFKESMIMEMNAGRRSRGLLPRFEDPKIERLILYRNQRVKLGIDES